MTNEFTPLAEIPGYMQGAYGMAADDHSRMIRKRVKRMDDSYRRLATHIEGRKSLTTHNQEGRMLP